MVLGDFYFIMQHLTDVLSDKNKLFFKKFLQPMLQNQATFADI
jgi:hypothetical protein